jgi:hypothetical protein
LNSDGKQTEFGATDAFLGQGKGGVVERDFLFDLSATIVGETSEIQRSIIAGVTLWSLSIGKIGGNPRLRRISLGYCLHVVRQTETGASGYVADVCYSTTGGRIPILTGV